MGKKRMQLYTRVCTADNKVWEWEGGMDIGRTALARPRTTQQSSPSSAGGSGHARQIGTPHVTLSNLTTYPCCSGGARLVPRDRGGESEARGHLDKCKIQAQDDTPSLFHPGRGPTTRPRDDTVATTVPIAQLFLDSSMFWPAVCLCQFTRDHGDPDGDPDRGPTTATASPNI